MLRLPPRGSTWDGYVPTSKGWFSAILNPPQSGILAVGAARRLPLVGEGGDIQIGSVMTVTLSADHRVLDGAVAATWLSAFQRRIENPLTILI
ncbi:2-oxo acid dehydrogenase subunit E2 [Microbacterium sp. 2MCAF23]|uniref:2-oxo acid dehydrogenase subunit E2 n=1 Tax=Microbacterium sp. 2MCAF23 TaxID=3232985 RepID=UPI003F966E26